MLFLNNTEDALTLSAVVTNLEVFTCTEKYDMAPPLTATVNQMTAKMVILTQKEKDKLNELHIQNNEYPNKNPDIKHKSTAIRDTDLLDMKLKMKQDQ